MEWTVALGALEELGTAFWSAAADVRLFAFHGAMGAGKTTIIAALCRALGVEDALSSPTFSIINEYGYAKDGRQATVYHIDLYRLRSDEEVVQSGVEDCVFSAHLCFVEWPEKAPWLFDEGAAHVFIEPAEDDTRKVSLKMPGGL